MYASLIELSKELKSGMKISLGQAVFKLWIKTVKILFWSILKNRLSYLKFNAVFCSLDNSLFNVYTIFQKGVNFDREHKTC